MKQTLTILVTFIITLFFVGCNGKTGNKQGEQTDSVINMVNDTALYGVIGEGTTMHVLELQSDGGKTIQLEIDSETGSEIIGGLYAGDRVTLTFKENTEGVKSICRLVNLTSLLGLWTSLDRNFRIQEDGVVESAGDMETRPYTNWTMSNTQIILNADTFDVIQLGPDSMSLENNNGIFVYKRQK